MPQADQELIQRIKDQDAAAFAVLHGRYEAALRRHLDRMVRDAHAAEDLLQEVFLRVWTRAHQFRGRGPFRPWLMKVATNLALNYLRSLKRRRERPLEMPADAEDPEDDESYAPAWMVDASALGPDAVAEQIEQKRILGELVRRLPEGKREVVRLVYEAEMDIREAADALTIPEGTVKSRLHYAVKTLARELEKRAGG